jgi:hypothetical protein
MEHEADLNPVFAPQFNIIEGVLTTGRPPRSLLADSFDSRLDSREDSRISRESLFSRDMADRALGLDNHRSDSYPDYRRRGDIPTREQSLRSTSDSIERRLGSTNRSGTVSSTRGRR